MDCKLRQTSRVMLSSERDFTEKTFCRRLCIRPMNKTVRLDGEFVVQLTATSVRRRIPPGIQQAGVLQFTQSHLDPIPSLKWEWKRFTQFQELPSGEWCACEHAKDFVIPCCWFNPTLVLISFHVGAV